MSPATSPTTLTIDVGSSHVKGYAADGRGKLLTERLRVDTPEDLTARSLLALLADVAGQLPVCDRVAVGLPGIVHRGIVYSLPLAADRELHRVPIAAPLAKRLGRPVRLYNDAELHGLGVIRRKGIELVLTLGSGLGTALFLDGSLGPRIQFVGMSDAEYAGGPVGDAALEGLGKKKWSQRVEGIMRGLRHVTHFDRCYLGGGNADKLKFDLPDDMVTIDAQAPALGGVRAWEWDVEV